MGRDHVRAEAEERELARPPFTSTGEVGEGSDDQVP